MNKMPIRIVSVIAGIVLFAGIMAGWAVYATQAIGGMPLSGWVAMSLGAIVTISVGVALMSLVFYSSRKGYDDPPRRE
jgi:hypothetical protein